MTLNLSINIEVPDDWGKVTDAELRTLLYEEYVRAVLFYHQESQMDAMMVQRNAVDDRGYEIAEACIAHHKQWSEMVNKVSWEMKRV